MRDAISKMPSLKVDYISIIDTKSLKGLAPLRGEILIAMAAFIGKTRLIDNIIVDTKKLGKVYAAGKTE